MHPICEQLVYQNERHEDAEYCADVVHDAISL